MSCHATLYNKARVLLFLVRYQRKYGEISRKCGKNLTSAWLPLASWRPHFLHFKHRGWYQFPSDSFFSPAAIHEGLTLIKTELLAPRNCVLTHWISKYHTLYVVLKCIAKVSQKSMIISSFPCKTFNIWYACRLSTCANDCLVKKSVSTIVKK